VNGEPVVLVVDDTPENLQVLGGLLASDGYQVRVAMNGAQALESARRSRPDLILLDYMMPGMNGIEVCRELKVDASLATVPIIFVSASDAGDHKIHAFQEGAVDYITKPFYADEVLARVRTNVQNFLYRQRLEDIVTQRTDQLRRVQEATITGMALLAERRDGETGAHVQRTRHYVRVLAEAMRESSWQLEPGEVDILLQSAPLHDIGKVGIPDSILLKPGPLTEQEFETVKTHTVIGRQVIETTIQVLGTNSFLECAKEITESHHERWDGSGYPHGLSGESIPRSARLMALADVYDSLRCRRRYKPSYPHERVRAILLEGDGRTSPTHFDPEVLEAFTRVDREFDRIAQQFDDV